MATKATKKKTNTRLNHSEGEARATRESGDRKISQNREMTDAERLDEFRMTNFQSILPDIPEIEGYHVCWLTTENPRDPIHSRMRLGYEPVTIDDVPGWGHQLALKSGEWEGCIGINEMLAFKIPLHLYNAYMTEAHYNQPNNEEEMLSMATREVEEQASQLARKPISFELEDGQEEIGQHVPAPHDWGG